jgi:hypothetical protein
MVQESSRAAQLSAFAAKIAFNARLLPRYAAGLAKSEEKQHTMTDRIDDRTWLELKMKEQERLAAALAAERKARPKQEAILLITCLLAVSYTYPVQSLSTNPTIDINAISIKIPLTDAITVFPTIVATLYLVFLGTALKESQTLVRLGFAQRAIRAYLEKGARPGEDLGGGRVRFSLLRYLV